MYYQATVRVPPVVCVPPFGMHYFKTPQPFHTNDGQHFTDLNQN